MKPWIILLAVTSLAALVSLFFFRPLEGLVSALVAAGFPQQSVSTLILVPLAVCVVVAMRVLLGIEGFGIFSPLILGLAFSKVGFLPGLTGFTLILLLLIPVRWLLEKVSILAVSRTGLLIGGCSLSILLLLYLGRGSALRADIGIPIVVMAGIVDRFVTAQMDQSSMEATRQSVSTLIIASVCALLAMSRVVGGILMNRPDLALLSLPLLTLIGGYKGLRLIELWRFRKAG